MAGVLTLTMRDADGRIIAHRRTRNLITTVGRQFTIDRLQGATPAVCDYIAIGTGTTAPAAGDTTLGTEVARAQGTLSQPDAYTDRCSYTFGPGVGTGAITECGRLNAASVGVLFGRQVFAALNKGANDSLQVIYDVQYPAAGGTLFSDNFSSGADGDPLAAPWEAIPGLGSLPQYSSGKASGALSGGTHDAAVSTVSLLNGYLQVKTSGLVSHAHILFARVQAAALTYYFVLKTGNTLTLYRRNGGAPVAVGAASAAFVQDAVLRLEMTDRNFTVLYNGATVITATDDSGSAILTAGKCGCGCDNTAAVLDDFQCGTL
jgi:hypothetical protein